MLDHNGNNLFFLNYWCETYKTIYRFFVINHIDNDPCLHANKEPTKLY